MKRLATYRDFVGELTVNYRRTEKPNVKITSSKCAEKFIRPYFDKVMDDHEVCKIIHLSNANHVVNVHHLSEGGETSTLVPISMICRNALHIKTSAIIMVHNHPSGKLVASNADIEITKKLQEAMKLIDLKLLDSMIITREGYLSMADENLM